MDFQKLLLKIAKILDDFDISYAITGGYAVSVWGRPRSTFDIDVIIELFEPQISRLTSALRKISEITYIEDDAVRRAVRRQGEFNFIHSDSGIKVDFWVIGNNPFSKINLKRRVPIKIAGEIVYFISAEDLILAKLQWYQKTLSDRQTEDIQSVLKISGDKLDKKYLELWIKRLKLEEVWEKVINLTHE